MPIYCLKQQYPEIYTKMHTYSECFAERCEHFIQDYRQRVVFSYCRLDNEKMERAEKLKAVARKKLLGMQSGEHFEPIQLIEVKNVRMKKGYYDCEIIDFSFERRNGKPLLVVQFEVFNGKYRGVRLSTRFHYKELKGRVKLTYLCSAVGITGQLNSPKELLGERLRLRVVPKVTQGHGRLFRNYVITRFHSLE